MSEMPADPEASQEKVTDLSVAKSMLLVVDDVSKIGSHLTIFIDNFVLINLSHCVLFCGRDIVQPFFLKG